MAIRKNGEDLTFSAKDNILTPQQALHDKKIAARFVKMAKNLRKIAPKAQDFLYGHAIMMHAAEASLVDQHTGEPVLDLEGNPITASFETIKLDNGKESVRWKCSKKDLMPYKNANGDIFPESELLKAYKGWIGKPLCKDHKSESVDGIRGIIIDTYYDPKFKRVHALFALDKKNYGDLARKVETGYANAVSMGTAVGRSVCTDCGNVAVTEREYCDCIRARKNFGEINLDLKPIELSLVVNGADGLAKIRNIVASMNNYVQTKQARINELVNDRCVNPTELQQLADSLAEMQTRLNGLMGITKAADVGEDIAASREIRELTRELETTADEARKEELKKLIEVFKQHLYGKKQQEKTWPPMRPGAGGPTVSPMAGGGEGSGKPSTTTMNGFAEPSTRYASTEGDTQGAFSKEIRLLRSKLDTMQNALQLLNQKVSKEENNMNSARLRARAKARRAYWLGGGGVNEPTPGKPKYEKEEADKIRDNEDKQMVGTVEMGSDGLYPGDEEKKREWGRDGLNLSKAELEDRAMKRRAYFLGGGGVNEPSPGKYPYEKDPMAEKVRNTEDKHMTGTYDMGGTDGMVPGDEPVKKQWLRAKLRAKFTKVADEGGNLRKDASHWDVYAGDKLILSATGDEIFGEKLDENWDYLSSRDYGKDVISHIRSDGFERVAYLLKGAAPPADPMAGGADPMAGGMDPMAGGADPMAAPEAPAPEGGKPEEKEDEDVKGKVDAALTKMEEAIEDIRTAVTEGGEKLVDIEVKVDDEKGEGGAETPVEALTASWQKEMMEVHALMNESADELALISEALESNEASNGMVKAAEQALADAEIILEAKKKKDEDKPKKEEKEDKKEDKEDEDEGLDKEAKKKAPTCNGCGKPFFQCTCDKDGKDKEDKKDKDDNGKDKKEEDKEEKESKAQKLLDDALRLRAENRASLLAKVAGEVDLKKMVEEKVDEELEGGLPAEDDMLALDPLADMADDEGCEGDDCMDADDDAEDFVIESEASVKEARRKAREELVSQAAEKILGKYELDLGPAQNATERTYFEAHPGGKGTTTDLTHTKTPEAKVETISEVHDVMRDVAESGPRNVREAAMQLQEEIVKGAIKVEDLDKLVAEGKVDSEAASYWKKYWAQGPDTGSFGADLSKEFASKKKEASDKGYRVKLRRAYDLGLVAQEKGMIGPTRAALDTYVDEVMQFDDAAFESTKRIVAGMNGKKSGSLPRVGADAATEAMNVTASADPVQEPALIEQLGSLGWK